MVIQGEKWVVKKNFVGLPKVDDFQLVKEDLGELQDGEIAYEAEYISVDPYQVKIVLFRQITRKYCISMHGVCCAGGTLVANVIVNPEIVVVIINQNIIVLYVCTKENYCLSTIFKNLGCYFRG